MQGLQTSNNFNSATGRAFRKFRKVNEVSNNCKADDWGEPDPLIDFSVEEILDMPTVSEVQPDPTPKVTDSDPQSEDGESETFGITNSNTLHLECNETVFPSSVKRNDLELIDIESLFIEDTDDRPVL